MCRWETESYDLGHEEGVKEGRIMAIASLYAKGLITMEQAVAEAGVA